MKDSEVKEIMVRAMDELKALDVHFLMMFASMAGETIDTATLMCTVVAHEMDADVCIKCADTMKEVMLGHCKEDEEETVTEA